MLKHRADEERKRAALNPEGDQPQQEPELEPVPSSSATTLRDTALAIWLQTCLKEVPLFGEEPDLLGVLRDELTTVQELAVLRGQAVAHSGT